MTTILEYAIAQDYDALEALGFYGTDASLEESLVEYRLAIMPCDQYKGNYTVLYATPHYSGEGVVWFIESQPPSYYTDKINDQWFDKDCFFECTDTTESRWLLMPLVNQIQDLIMTYGADNIM